MAKRRDGACQLSIRCSPEFLQMVDEFLESREGRQFSTRSDFIRYAVRFYMEHLRGAVGRGVGGSSGGAGTRVIDTSKVDDDFLSEFV